MCLKWRVYLSAWRVKALVKSSSKAFLDAKLHWYKFESDLKLIGLNSSESLVNAFDKRVGLRVERRLLLKLVQTKGTATLPGLLPLSWRSLPSRKSGKISVSLSLCCCVLHAPRLNCLVNWFYSISQIKNWSSWEMCPSSLLVFLN